MVGPADGAGLARDERVGQAPGQSGGPRVEGGLVVGARFLKGGDGGFVGGDRPRVRGSGLDERRTVGVESVTCLQGVGDPGDQEGRAVLAGGEGAEVADARLEGGAGLGGTCRLDLDACAGGDRGGQGLAVGLKVGARLYLAGDALCDGARAVKLGGLHLQGADACKQVFEGLRGC